MLRWVLNHQATSDDTTAIVGLKMHSVGVWVLPQCIPSELIGLGHTDNHINQLLSLRVLKEK